MGEEWWKDRDSGVGADNDAISPMQNDPVPLAHDQDFSSEAFGALSGFFLILLCSLFIVPFGAAGVFAIVESIFSGEIELIFFGLLFLCVPLLFLYWLLNSFSIHRLRVQHSTDLLIFDSTFRGREFHSEERRLSEAVYLEYRETTRQTTDSEGRSTTHTSITAIVHGCSSEEGEWKLRIGDLVESYQSKQKKALEIADAIGIELEVRIRR